MSIKVKSKKDRKPEEELSRKVGLFDQISDHCSACLGPFDKKNKQMVMAWYVVVREKEKKVNLYCPGCWQTAVKALEEVKFELSCV